MVSDFRALHRIDDPFRLPSSRFFALAEWMPAYPGACQASIRLAYADRNPAPLQAPAQPQPQQGGVTQIDDVGALAAYVPDLIDYGG